MKKMFLILFIGTIAILTGCNGKNSNDYYKNLLEKEFEEQGLANLDSEIRDIAIEGNSVDGLSVFITIQINSDDVNWHESSNLLNDYYLTDNFFALKDLNEVRIEVQYVITGTIEIEGVDTIFSYSVTTFLGENTIEHNVDKHELERLLN